LKTRFRVRLKVALKESEISIPIRFSSGEILSDSYIPVSNLELIEKFAEHYPNGDGRNLKVNLEIEAVGMAAPIYFTDEKRSVELRELGDLAFGGIQIGNSEVGLGVFDFGWSE
jgi:hypothetical protein